VFGRVDRAEEGGKVHFRAWFRKGFELLGDEVAVRDVGFSGAVSKFRAHGFTDLFNVRLILAFKEFGVEFASESFGGIVAVFLEGLDFTGQAALNFDEFGIFLGIGEQFADEVGPEEDSGEGGSGRLEADFRDFRGVMATERFGEVVLESVEFEGVGLSGTPFSVAAVGFPIGDITFGDLEVAFLEGGDNFAVGEVIREHPIDHVAFGLGEVGNFTISGFAIWTGLALNERSGLGA
jgi:CBS domain-containing protein